MNNAGLVTGGLLEEQDLDDIYAMFQVNLTGVVQLTQAVLPGMIERGAGKIVNNASISGYAYFPAATTYAASKAGVVAFTESLRRELKGTGVTTLILVTPGVNTDMLDATEDAYGSYLDTSDWQKQEPEEWAAKAVKAVRDDNTVLGPGRQDGDREASEPRAGLPDGQDLRPDVQPHSRGELPRAIRGTRAWP